MEEDDTGGLKRGKIDASTELADIDDRGGGMEPRRIDVVGSVVRPERDGSASSDNPRSSRYELIPSRPEPAIASKFPNELPLERRLASRTPSELDCILCAPAKGALEPEIGSMSRLPPDGGAIELIVSANAAAPVGRGRGRGRGIGRLAGCGAGAGASVDEVATRSLSSVNGSIGDGFSDDFEGFDAVN